MRAELTLEIATIVSDERPSPTRAELDLDQVERARAGDRAAFETLVRRYQQPVFYLCLRYLKNDADAADATQRAFVKAYQGLDGFRGQASFRTWLFRIAINLSLNHLRDHKRERPAPLAEDTLVEAATGAQRLLGRERSRALRAAIDELPPKQRMVLELRVWSELPFKEVAELADCSENAAKVNFHYAVKRLREILGGGDE